MLGVNVCLFNNLASWANVGLSEELDKGLSELGICVVSLFLCNLLF